VYDFILFISICHYVFFKDNKYLEILRQGKKNDISKSKCTVLVKRLKLYLGVYLGVIPN